MGNCPIPTEAKHRQSLNYGITVGKAWHFEEEDQALSWINERMVQWTCMHESFLKIANVVLNDVKRKTAISEKISLVRYSADTLGTTYLQVIQWLLDLHRVKANHELEVVLSIMEKHGKELLTAIESLSKEVDGMIHKAALEDGKPQEIDGFQISLKADISEPAELLKAIEAMKSKKKGQVHS